MTARESSVCSIGTAQAVVVQGRVRSFGNFSSGVGAKSPANATPHRWAPVWCGGWSACCCGERAAQAPQPGCFGAAWGLRRRLMAVAAAAGQGRGRGADAPPSPLLLPFCRGFCRVFCRSRDTPAAATPGGASAPSRERRAAAFGGAADAAARLPVKLCMICRLLRGPRGGGADAARLPLGSARNTSATVARASGCWGTPLFTIQHKKLLHRRR